MSKRTSQVASAKNSNNPPLNHKTGFTTADNLITFYVAPLTHFSLRQRFYLAV